MQNVSSSLPAPMSSNGRYVRWIAVALVVLSAGCSAGAATAEDAESSSEALGARSHRDDLDALDDSIDSLGAWSGRGANRGGRGGRPQGANDDGGTTTGARPRRDDPGVCERSSRGETAIVAQVRIDEYLGTKGGRNGSHELAFGTIVSTSVLADPTAVDTPRVKLAMNIASGRDPEGLPHEIPLAVGQVIELKGEYIPSTRANGATGGRAVIHFTHSPCGYVSIEGHQYQ